MSDLITPLTPQFYIEIPRDLISIVGWLVFLGVLIWLTLRLRERKLALDRKSLLWLALFSLMVLITTPFFGITLEIGDPLPIPGRPEEPRLPHLMFFAALPWLLAGGMVGLWPSVFLAGISGLLLAYLDTHSIFTPLHFMALVLVFSSAVRQRFRTWTFRLLRFPLFAALYALLVVSPVVFLTLLLEVPDAIVVRIEYAISQFPGIIVAIGGMVLIGGFVSLFFKVIAPKAWNVREELRPAPGEISIKIRLFSIIGPLLLVLLVGLVISDWVVAERSASKIMASRLTSSAQLAAEGIPYYIETGQNLILQMASDPGLSLMTPEEITSKLDSSLRTVPYFTQLALIDPEGNLTASYPPTDFSALFPSPKELMALDLALDGVRIQAYAIPPEPEDDSARMGFFATVFGPTGDVSGVLWGRADIADNPFSQPFLEALEEISEMGGTGQIIGDDDEILFHTIPQRVMKAYTGESYNTPTYFDGTASDGTRQVQFYQPVVGRQWAVLVTMPASAVQNIAWQTAFPLLVVVLIAFAAIYLTMIIGLNSVVQAVEQISETANKIAHGNFEAALPKKHSFGELQRLERHFSEMVETLRRRLEAQESLLAVSDKISGQQNLQVSLEVVLRTAMERGVSSARIVLQNTAFQRKADESHIRFGMGRNSSLYAYLDSEILTLTQSRGPLMMNDIHIGKAMNIAESMPYPNALISLPLTLRGSVSGVLWVAHAEKTWFSDEEIKFFEDLAQRATLAVATSKAIEEAVTASKRCEAVLDTLPDPVLIFDPHGSVVFLNGAARELPGIGSENYQGRQLTTIFRNEDILNLFDEVQGQPQTQEIEFTNGKTYHTLVGPIRIEGHRSGMVFIFKDVTRYKELDSLKSEFVATVSHELRSPLTLILGYAQILKLIGNMNEQQETYVGHIIEGVEEMKNLVKNLLDLGRLEAGDALDISQIAAGDIVHQVVGSLEVHAQQKNIQMNVSVPAEPIRIAVDVTFLTQAVKNLVENAIKFTPMGGRVDVGVRREEAQVVFSVEDNGIGIAPLDQRRLFEKFYRPGVPNQNQRGSGLGLAIVKSIVERHGGEVWFESQLGKGSSFYIRIPTQPAT
jgi:PAS domain S-box-containing protein